MLDTNMYRLVELENGEWFVEKCVGGGNWDRCNFENFKSQEQAQQHADRLKRKRVIEA